MINIHHNYQLPNIINHYKSLLITIIQWFSQLPKEPRGSAGLGQGELGEQRVGPGGGAQQGRAVAGVIQGAPGGPPGVVISGCHNMIFPAKMVIYQHQQ